MDKRHTGISKFLSLVLRHKPQEIGLELDPEGWVAIDELLAAAAAHGHEISRHELEFVVAHNNKKRFALSEDGLRIRASQGHSVSVELGYEPATPPERLYHGTARQHLSEIRKHGLLRGKRHHVHLSPDEATARLVGQRHGRPVVLGVRAGDMLRAGFTFWQSANGVWLVDNVPYRFVEELDTGLR